jgi:hypothetical protein
MKTLHIAILTACITIASFSAIGAEKIDGAFGKKLGDVFDPASAIGTSKLTDDTPIYEFSTTNGFLSFKRYYVLITPTTHKIYSIWGTGGVKNANAEAGQTEQAIVMELLKKKYGTEERLLPGMGNTIGYVRQIDQGHRYIFTRLTDVSSNLRAIMLEIRYYDSDLEKLAEAERNAAETKKADASGL